MKVFYVLVLVLVAGAVPCHGRTESEGTVFNKTQLHESMNNVTVSSSKLMLETYRVLILAMQWPRSFCLIRGFQCNRQDPDLFTVHGLWPQSHNGRIDCTRSPRYRQYSPFSRGQLPPGLVRRLNHFWPDLATIEDSNQCFWGTEYKKHGSCTFNNQTAYFDNTLRLVNGLGTRNLISQIRGQGNNWRVFEIRRAVRAVTGIWPKLHCSKVGESFQLLEIRFCADRYIQLVHCWGLGDCGNAYQRVYLP